MSPEKSGPGARVCGLQSIDSMLQKIVARSHFRFRVGAILAALAVAPASARSQTIAPSTTDPSPDSAPALEALIARAMSASPELAAARARLTAARARITSAGQMPDPSLMVGFVNLPVNSLSFTADDMTMKMIGIEQTIPFPGKLGLRRSIASKEADAMDAVVDSTRLSVIRKVKNAYYELAYLDHALAIVVSNQKVLSDFATVTEARYSVGSGSQQDVLKARVEATRLAETANSIEEQRKTVLASLNAELDRPSETPVDSPRIPSRIAAAAIPADAIKIRFVSNTLGAAVADSPLPPLDVLQTRAIDASPALRADRRRIDAQMERVALAQKDFKPDFDVSLQYGQRSGRSGGGMGNQLAPGAARSDMISAQVSFPLRIHKGTVQQQELAEARADLAALDAERAARSNNVRAEVARLYSEVERNRTQLAIYSKAVLPQGRGVLASAIAGYQSGTSDLLTLLDSQNTLFTYETAYYRALVDFAKSVAALDEMTGGEVLQ